MCVRSVAGLVYTVVLHILLVKDTEFLLGKHPLPPLIRRHNKELKVPHVNCTDSMSKSVDMWMFPQS